MWVKCVLVWYSQPLTSIFGLVNSRIKKMRLQCRLHPSHSMSWCMCSVQHFNHKLQILIWGVLNQENISQFCAVVISFPTMGASFMLKNYWIWSIIHRDILSVNIHINDSFLRYIDISKLTITNFWKNILLEFRNIFRFGWLAKSLQLCMTISDADADT